MANNSPIRSTMGVATGSWGFNCTVQGGSTVSLLLLVRLLRAPARSHARFGGCPPGQLIANSESGVFVAALPARHSLAPHPVGRNPVQRLACVPALAAVGLHLECLEDSRPQRSASTVPGTFAFPAARPGLRSGGLVNSVLPGHERYWLWRSPEDRVSGNPLFAVAVGLAPSPQGSPTLVGQELPLAAGGHPGPPRSQHNNNNN